MPEGNNHDAGPAVTTQSIATVWALWRLRSASIVVPGHDIPMGLKEGRPEYLAARQAAIKAWFGDELETTTWR